MKKNWKPAVLVGIVLVVSAVAILTPSARTDVVRSGGSGGGGGGGLSCPLSCPGAGANSEKYGASALAGGTSGVAVGNTASAAGVQSVAVGSGASASTTQSVAVGYNALAATNASTTAVGAGAIVSGAGGTAIGAGATGSGTNATAIGSLANAGSFSCTVVGGGGGGGTCNADNDIVLGIQSNASTLYLGGSYAGTQTQSFSGMEAIASNANSGALLLRPGRSTGTGTAGDLLFNRVPTTQGSGSSQNAQIRAIQIVSKAKALTNSTATAVVQIGGLGAHDAAGGHIFFAVRASDGTNDQEVTVDAAWAFINTTAGAGGEVCSVTEFGYVTIASSGTLDAGVDTTTGTDVCNLRITPTSSLTPTVLEVYYTVMSNSRTATITPQ